MVLLYDCDINNFRKENVDNKLYKIQNQLNQNNQIYKKGIESLLPEMYFEDCSKFVIISEPTFDSVGKKDIDKPKLCDHLCKT